MALRFKRPDRIDGIKAFGTYPSPSGKRKKTLK